MKWDVAPTADIEAVLQHVTEHELPAIRNHSVRVLIHARAAAESLGYRSTEHFVDDELRAAALLHDLGTSPAADGAQRFEVDGGDAAVQFLRGRGWTADACRRVWTAIVLHTSPGIAERFDPLTHLVRTGVLIDFGKRNSPGIDTPALEAEYPRLDAERTLADAVVRQALDRPDKAPASSWPGGLLRAHLAQPDHGGVNPAF